VTLLQTRENALTTTDPARSIFVSRRTLAFLTVERAPLLLIASTKGKPFFEAQSRLSAFKAPKNTRTQFTKE
jgi:hypothetical protein